METYKAFTIICWMYVENAIFFIYSAIQFGRHKTPGYAKPDSIHRNVSFHHSQPARVVEYVFPLLRQSILKLGLRLFKNHLITQLPSMPQQFANFLSIRLYFAIQWRKVLALLHFLAVNDRIVKALFIANCEL